MDKATLKLRLGAYRTGGQDADDPLFAEALREVARDPALAAWFAEEQRFDALMVEKFREVAAAPAGLKEAILLDARPASAAAGPSAASWWRGHGWTPLALAAGLTLAFFLGRLTLPTVTPPPRLDPGSPGGGLALQAIAYTGRMPALQFVCFDASKVAGWVDEKASALKMGKLMNKPVGNMNMRMIGSSATEWEGKPVIMIALQNGERMAMLYLLRASDFRDAADAAGGIMEKDGWVSQTGRRGEHLFVLTTKGTRRDLDFPMPL